jgi:hypothetical protein
MQDETELVSPWIPPVYANETSAAICYLNVRGQYGLMVRRSGVIGYLWASTIDDAAGFLPRHDAGTAGTDASAAWLLRLRRATQVGLTPSQVLRFWIGRGWDGSGLNPGHIVSEQVEQGLPSLHALQTLADPSGGLAGSDQRVADAQPNRTSRYATTTHHPVRFGPVTENGQTLGYVWTALGDHAAYFVEQQDVAPEFRNTVLDAGIRWRRRLADAAADGTSPVEFFEQWTEATERLAEPASLYISPYVVEETPSLITVLRRAGIPVDTEAGLAAPLRIPGVNVPVPDGSYCDFTFSAVRTVTVWCDDRVMGYVWASTDNQAAGFLRRHDAYPDSWKAANIWYERLDSAHGRGLAPLQAMREWIGAPPDPGCPDAGYIPGDVSELEEPHLARLYQRARRYLAGDERHLSEIREAQT